jgi:UDP-galactopyranose mutase
MRILVVGAGFAGAVHARVLAEAGHKLIVIDKRPHIGGNCFDFVDGNGVRVHAYGPHLFHTKSPRIVDWLKQWGETVPYRHKVRALLPSGALAPLPINLNTVNLVFGTAYQTAGEVEGHLRKVALQITEPKNAAEHLYSKIGTELTDLLFRPYTKKMWALDLEDMSASVVKRLPLRFDKKDTYFADDEIQMMPRDGYTALFERIFAHPNIEVRLGVAFAKAMLTDYDFCFNSMPIDEFFDFCLGELPYRSIRFHHRTEKGGEAPEWSVVNFTDNSPFTRETIWDALPCHRVQENSSRTISREEPCDYRDNNHERYYPVKTADGRYQQLYENYKKLAEAVSTMDFIGRCGTYQYLDMDQVINQSLINAQRYVVKLSEAP